MQFFSHPFPDRQDVSVVTGKEPSHKCAAAITNGCRCKEATYSKHEFLAHKIESVHPSVRVDRETRNNADRRYTYPSTLPFSITARPALRVFIHMYIYISQRLKARSLEIRKDKMKFVDPTRGNSKGPHP